LKLALERLLGERCYHMFEVLQRPETMRFWSAAGRGDMPDWNEVFHGYGACVDWPAAAYWPEIAAAFPDALVLLSRRATADEWYRSAKTTIFAVDPTQQNTPAADADLMAGMVAGMFQRFTHNVRDSDAAMAAYEAHNQRVRDSIPPSRLLEWQPGDGWAPICRALELLIPDEPFPHANTGEAFRQRLREMGRA
jgi:Sulfotransferase domain